MLKLILKYIGCLDIIKIDVYCGLEDESGHASNVIVDILLGIKKIDYKLDGING